MSEAIFKKFFERLKEEFKDEAMKMFYTMNLVGIYPLIAEVGFPISHPLAIIVERETEIAGLMEYLSWFNCHDVISLGSKPTELENSISQSKFGVVFLALYDGRYSFQNMETIISKSQRLEQDISRRMLFVVFVVKAIPQKYTNFFAGQIFANEVSGMAEELKIIRSEFINELIPFAIGHCKEIKNEALRRYRECGEEFCVFHVVQILFELLLKTQRLSGKEMEEYRKEVNEGLEKIMQEWEITDDPEVYKIIFRKKLYENLVLFSAIYDRRKVPGEIENSIGYVIFYDTLYYYFPLVLFRILFQEMGNVTYIESQLAKAGVIVCEGSNRNYYTKKTEIVTAYGKIIRKRLVKISRAEIDVPCELSLQEIMEAKGGDESNGNTVGNHSQCTEICANR